MCSLNGRNVNLHWRDNATKKYVTNVIIYTEKKDNLLLDIISKTTSMSVGVKSVNTISNTDYNAYDLDILVDDKETLDRYMNVIGQLPFVTSIERGNK